MIATELSQSTLNEKLPNTTALRAAAQAQAPIWSILLQSICTFHTDQQSNSQHLTVTPHDQCTQGQPIHEANGSDYIVGWTR